MSPATPPASPPFQVAEPVAQDPLAAKPLLGMRIAAWAARRVPVVPPLLRETAMSAPNAQDQVSDKDRLLTRPEDKLPTPLDPAAPESRGYPADPKPGPPCSPGLPDGSDRDTGDLGKSV